MPEQEKPSTGADISKPLQNAPLPRPEPQRRDVHWSRDGRLPQLPRTEKPE